MKVVITGANGQLGSDVAAAFEAAGSEVYSLNHADIELSCRDSVTRNMERISPALIVNTAAMHHVEKCEQEPERAFAVNGLGARNLAFSARDTGATLIHVSTDYVFDGAKGRPYQEGDAPLPLNVYGNTKLSGEGFIRSICEKSFVLRTSAIYGRNPCRAKGGLNFVELMLKMARERKEVRVVDSEFVTPTPTKDIAQQIMILSRSQAYGLYHATAEGSCSWYEFAAEIFALTRSNISLQKANPGEFPMKTPRPTYSVLENFGLKKLGLNAFRCWKTGLCDYIESGKAEEKVR